MKRSCVKPDERDSSRLQEGWACFKDLRVEELEIPRRIALKMISQAAIPKGPLTEEMFVPPATPDEARALRRRIRLHVTPETDRLIEQLKHAQDALGDWHDWFMLTETSS